MTVALVILNLSTGSFLANVLPETARQIVYSKQGTVVTPGVSGYDVVQLLNPTVDAQFQAASSGSPIKLGLDSITFKPLQYPELAGE
jgi:hypothetical protein